MPELIPPSFSCPPRRSPKRPEERGLRHASVSTPAQDLSPPLARVRDLTHARVLQDQPLIAAPISTRYFQTQALDDSCPSGGKAEMPKLRWLPPPGLVALLPAATGPCNWRGRNLGRQL